MMSKNQSQIRNKASKNVERDSVNKFMNFIFNKIKPFTKRTISEETLESEECNIDYELEQLLNMCKLPAKLEWVFLFSLLACLDCFMYYFTIIPLRLINGLVRKKGYVEVAKEIKILLLILISSVLLLRVDTSRVYHRIKGQSEIKLYVMFQVLEMCDKMLSSISHNLLSLVLVPKGNDYSIKNVGLFFTTLLYLQAHTFVLMYQTIALNVAVNSYSNSLMTLLLSIQFAELKSSVFKRIDKEGLFQLTIADIVERFQLLLFLTITACRNLVANGNSISQILPNSWRIKITSSVVLSILYGPMVTVIGSELLVDWVKHGYVTKFNRIRPHTYDKFLYLLYQDHQRNIHGFQTRIGLPVPALVVLFIVLVSPTISQSLYSASTSNTNSIVILLLGTLCLVLAKFVLHVFLTKWIKVSQVGKGTNTDIYVPGALSSGMGKVDDRMRFLLDSSSISSCDQEAGNLIDTMDPNLPVSPTELRIKKDLKHPHSLEQVTRFKMVSKRIW